MSHAHPEFIEALKASRDAAIVRAEAAERTVEALRIREELGVEGAELGNLRTKLVAAEADNAALVKALKNLQTNAFHSAHCPAFPPGCMDEPCRCGYDDAENETHAALTSPHPGAALLAAVQQVWKFGHRPHCRSWNLVPPVCDCGHEALRPWAGKPT